MSTQARLPIPPLSADIEALLAYERDFSISIDMIRARAVTRAQHAVQANGIVSTAGELFVAGGRLSMSAGIGILVTAGVLTTVELLLSRTAQQPTHTSAVPATVFVSPPVVDVAQSAAADTKHADETASRQPSELINAPKASPAAKSDEGMEELRLLERARQADRRGDYASVLASTREHQRRFSDGRLVEEREVLRIKALIGLGQIREAQLSAALFRKSFPRSVLLESIDRMMTSLP